MLLNQVSCQIQGKWKLLTPMMLNSKQQQIHMHSKISRKQMLLQGWAIIHVMMQVGQVIGTQTSAPIFVPVGIGCMVCVMLGFHGQALVAGAYRGSCCEELPAAFPMSDRADGSWLKDRPTPGQGQGHQQGGGASGVTQLKRDSEPL